MIKTYKANTNISINVVLPSKKNLHVTFTPLSNGSSVFITDNEIVQKAIESHYNFNKLFRLFSEQNIALQNQVEIKKASIENNIDTEQDEEESDNLFTEIIVSDLASAKDYLADKFGVSRTAMRSEKTILAKAAQNNIRFVGL